MTFVDDNGNVLQFDGEFAMTKQSVSFFDFKIKGDVSLNFEVDNNSVNRKVLNYDGPMMASQVAFTKQAFNRMRNGNILDRGYIVIQSEEEDKLNCFYLSGNSNWVQLVRGLITELDWTGVTNGTDYNIILSSANVTTKVSATEGIIFPMVDWCYDLRKGNANYFMYGGIVDVTNNTDNSMFDFYPCLYVHTLVKEIMQQNGLKIAGNLLTDPIYKSLVITPRNGQMKREPFKNVIAYGSSQTNGTAGYIKYTSFTESQDPDNLFSSNRFTADKTAAIYITITVVSYDPNIGGVDIYKNGVSVFSGHPGVDVPAVFKTQLLTHVRGDYFEVYFENIGFPIATNLTLNIKIETPEVIGVGDYVNPSFFLPAISCLDVIKFVSNFFGCSVFFEDYSKTLNLNIIEKMKRESATDFSEFYLSHRSEYTVNQAENNYIKWQSNGLDSAVVKYNSLHQLNFGDGNIETGNTLKKNNTLASYPFFASALDLSINGFQQTNIPLVNLVDDGDAISFTAIASVSAGISRFTFASGPVFAVSEVIRLTNSDSVDIGYYVINAVTSTTIDVYFTFSATDTGKIRRQRINYQEVGARILTVKPTTSVADFSTSSSYTLFDGSLASSSKTTIPFACFTKPVILNTIDQWKNNLAIDNPDSGGFTDPTIKELYFQKISSFLQNPDIRCKMIIPEDVYQSFKFDRLIYLKTEKLTGYFFLDSIVNYKDSNTPVEVNLYMI